MSEAVTNFVKQVSKFSIIGAVATVVHIIIAESLIHSTIIAPLRANLFAFSVALFISFVGHYYWSFSCQAHKGRAFLRFFVVALIAMAANNALLSVLLILDWFVIDVSIVVAALVVPILSFILGRTWAFAS